jgi:hypothetical protein
VRLLPCLQALLPHCPEELGGPGDGCDREGSRDSASVEGSGTQSSGDPSPEVRSGSPAGGRAREGLRPGRRGASASPSAALDGGGASRGGAEDCCTPCGWGASSGPVPGWHPPRLRRVGGSWCSLAPPAQHSLSPAAQCLGGGCTGQTILAAAGGSGFHHAVSGAAQASSARRQAGKERSGGMLDGSDDDAALGDEQCVGLCRAAEHALERRLLSSMTARAAASRTSTASMAQPLQLLPPASRALSHEGDASIGGLASGLDSAAGSFRRWVTHSARHAGDSVCPAVAGDGKDLVTPRLPQRPGEQPLLAPEAGAAVCASPPQAFEDFARASSQSSCAYCTPVLDLADTDVALVSRA